MNVKTIVRILLVASMFFSLFDCCCVATGQERAQADHFEQTIRPLFISRCIECHGPDRQEASLRLDSRAGWMKGVSEAPQFTQVIRPDPWFYGP